MPIKNIEDRKKYMKAYMLNRYYSRRAEAVEFLGSKCVDCGTLEALDFDHKNPKQKSFDIGKAFASMEKTKLYVEVAKCELRCRPCHLIKGGYDAAQELDVLILAKGL